MLYFKDFQNNDYLIPETLKERFLYVLAKVDLSRKDKFPESYNGYLVVLKREFSQYKVLFKKNSVWVKQTEEWHGNMPKGGKVKLISNNEDFVKFKDNGKAFVLNKWSFLRIFKLEES